MIGLGRRKNFGQNMKESLLELLNKRHSCLPLETVISGCGAWNDCGHLAIREEIA